jgi:hypothetical protein
MGWLEDLGNAVFSGVAVVGDAVETVVETVTDTAENVVDAGADAMEDSFDYVVDWVNINGGAVVGGIANVIGGSVSGAIDAVQQLVSGVLHIVKDVGAIVGSLLRLDLRRAAHRAPRFLHRAHRRNFDRNSLRRFVSRLLGNTFADPRLHVLECRRQQLRGLGTVWLLLECRAVLHQQRQEECVALHRRPAAQRAIAPAQFGEVAISATRQAIYAGLR